MARTLVVRAGGRIPTADGVGPRSENRPGPARRHELIDWLVRQNHAADRCVEFSVGFDVDADVRAAIAAVRPDCWAPALDNTDGTARDDADVTEITELMRHRLERTGWPRRLQVIVRRTRLAPGEQPTLFQLDGYKYSCFVTTTATLNVQLLDARHRARARVEDQVRTTKAELAWNLSAAPCVVISTAPLVGLRRHSSGGCR